MSNVSLFTKSVETLNKAVSALRDLRARGGAIYMLEVTQNEKINLGMRVESWDAPDLLEGAYGVKEGLWYDPVEEVWYAWSDMTRSEQYGDRFEAESKRMKKLATWHWEVIKLGRRTPREARLLR